MVVAKNERPVAQRPVKQARPKPGQVSPNLDSMFDADFDPIPLSDYPGINTEVDADFEISETLRRIKEEKRARREQYRILTDPNFYLVVCFQSTMQRDEFIEKAGWQDFGAPFIDGLELARLLGVDVAPIFLERKQVRAAPKSLRGAASSASNLEPRKE